jgi:hypothetical protein
MTNENQQLITLRQAQECHKLVLRLKERIVLDYLELGEALHKINRQKLYLVLGYKTFDDYIFSPEVAFKRAMVFKLISIYETFIVGLNYPKERLSKINWSKLSAVVPYKGQVDPDRLLTMAEEMPRAALIKELKKFKPKLKRPTEYGEKINLPILMHAPINEMGVVFLFAALCDKLGFSVDYITTKFPDCHAKRKLPNGRWRSVSIEFEYLSKDLLKHSHDVNECDLILCWEDNWTDCPIEVISLKAELRKLALDGMLKM